MLGIDFSPFHPGLCFFLSFGEVRSFVFVAVAGGTVCSNQYEKPRQEIILGGYLLFSGATSSQVAMTNLGKETNGLTLLLSSQRKFL